MQHRVTPAWWREPAPGSRDNGAKMAAGGLSARCGAGAAWAEGRRGQRGGGPGSRCGRTPLRGTGGREGPAGRGRSAGPGGFNCGGARAGLAPPPPRARGEAPPPGLGDPQGPSGSPGSKSPVSSDCRHFVVLYFCRAGSELGSAPSSRCFGGAGGSVRAPFAGVPDGRSALP